MRFEFKENVIAIEVLEVEPDHLPYAGDLELDVMAVVGNFSGRTTSYVSAPDFCAFANAIRGVAETSKGIASLASESPGEFSMTLGPANGRGYVRIDLEIGDLNSGNKMSGSFEVEPWSLNPLVRWAQDHAQNS